MDDGGRVSTNTLIEPKRESGWGCEVFGVFGGSWLGGWWLPCVGVQVKRVEGAIEGDLQG